MSPPPCVCSLSVRMAVKLEVLHGAPYVVCVELKNLYLFVFCFGGLLFVSRVAVCGCGDEKRWDGCCWGKFV